MFDQTGDTAAEGWNFPAAAQGTTFAVKPGVLSSIHRVWIRSCRGWGDSTYAGARIDARAIYLEHGSFLWRSLQRLGVRSPDLEDVMQEVLLVVHRRAASFDPSRSRVTTWLFGICLRVARGYQRRQRRRRESTAATAPEQCSADTPETELHRRDAQRRLLAALDTMSVEKRATFVLFELEGLSCSGIAELMGVPPGTVHSRIHAARDIFKRALEAGEARS